MQKHNDDTIKTSGHRSLEKYNSHFIRNGSKGLRKVLSVRGVLETEQNCIILTPNSSGYNSISFPFSWAVQPEAWGPNLCWDMVLIPASSSPSDLNFQSPGLYNNLMSTYLRVSQFALSSTRRQSRLSPDIFDWMHLLFTQVHFLF